MRWLAWTAVTFAMHFVWEMSQAKWFVGMAELPFWTGTFLCLRASLGDIVITAVAFVSAAAASRTLLWPRLRRTLPFTMFMLVGLIITIAYEVFALRTGRWSYGPEMPTLFGIGLLPLLQWTIIPPIEVVIFRALWRRGPA
ncbi:MAG TPA: hypothetical protein VMS98_04420 [Thermoanaerobaculia bacterium]|nr:hypothetical protein [Thermoanaerobaculia bacterium]